MTNSHACYSHDPSGGKAPGDAGLGHWRDAGCASIGAFAPTDLLETRTKNVRGRLQSGARKVGAATKITGVIHPPPRGKGEPSAHRSSKMAAQ